MNDDELVERLRRTLRAEADAVRPGRGARVSPLAQPPQRRPFGSRVLVAAAAAVVAAATLVAVSLSGHGRAPSVAVEGRPGPGTSVPAPTHARQHPVTATTAPAPGPPTTSPVSTPTIAPDVVRPASDFVPESVTFVTADDGWVLGVEHCAGAPCLTLAQTTDGGRTWAVVSAPPVTVAMPATGSDGFGLQVRFATSLDGWVWGDVDGTPELWATYDGGTHWSRPVVPGLGAGTTIDSLETAGGLVHLATISASSSTVGIASSTVGSATWTTAAVSPATGAGPVPDASITLQQSAGWTVVDNRVTVDGARLVNGAWTAWRPPCSSSAGPVYLAASSPSDVDAICDAGLFDAPVTNELLVSSDAGTSFHLAGTAPTGVTRIASPVAGTVVGLVTGSGQIIGTFDGGASWRTVYNGPGQEITQVGFEDADQGVAIAGATASPAGQLLMTHDGGQHWTALDLGA